MTISVGLNIELAGRIFAEMRIESLFQLHAIFHLISGDTPKTQRAVRQLE